MHRASSSTLANRLTPRVATFRPQNHIPSIVWRQSEPCLLRHILRQPLRQPVSRRQFHASSPHRNIFLAPIELIQSVAPLFLAVPLAAFIPHVLRLILEVSVCRRRKSRALAIKPLIVAHDTVIGEKARQNASRLKTAEARMEEYTKAHQIRGKFRDNIEKKFDSSINVWYSTHALPCVLHLGWTCATLLYLGHEAPISVTASDEPFYGYLDPASRTSACPSLTELVAGLMLTAQVLEHLNTYSLLALEPAHALKAFPWLKEVLPSNDEPPAWMKLILVNAQVWHALPRALFAEHTFRNQSSRFLVLRWCAANILFIVACTAVLVNLSPLQTLYLFGSLTASAYRGRWIIAYNRAIAIAMRKNTAHWARIAPKR